MTDVLACLAGLALIVFGLCRRAALRGGRVAPALRQAHRFAFCLGAALLVLAPTSALAVERAVDVPGLPMLLGDVLRMLAVACLGLLAERPARRGGAAALAVALAAPPVLLPALFFAADLRHAAGRLTVDGGHRPFLAAYDAVLVLYPAWWLAAAGRTVRARARRTGPGPLRTGLRLLAAAVAAGLVWTAWGLDDVRLVLLTGRQTDGDDTVSTALSLLCAVLVAAGGSAAAWPALRHWWWCLRTYRSLTPLWSALHQAFPTTALPTRRPPLALPAPLSPHRLRFALYRRVIEIHDGLLLLRPHFMATAGGGPTADEHANAGGRTAADGCPTTDTGPPYAGPAADGCPAAGASTEAGARTEAGAGTNAASSSDTASPTGSGPRPDAAQDDDPYTAATRIAHALRHRTPLPDSPGSPPSALPFPLPLRPTTGTDPAAAQLAAVSRAFDRLG
ncbi:MAB_1171c family putative transporter [Streptomyces mobaraensis]|uniref:MAB_1171c family putative transporter n=1 Tax=Streptomyces mobaraensis TaxID=35621 RepID=UPI0033241004